MFLLNRQQVLAPLQSKANKNNDRNDSKPKKLHFTPNVVLLVCSQLRVC